MMTEVSLRVDDKGFLHVLFHLFKQPFLLRNVAYDVNLVVLRFKLQLLPNI